MTDLSKTLHEDAIRETMKEFACDRVSAEQIVRERAISAAADPDGSRARAAHAARMVPVNATYDAAFKAARAEGKGFAASHKIARRATEAAHGSWLAARAG